MTRPVRCELASYAIFRPKPNLNVQLNLLLQAFGAPPPLQLSPHVLLLLRGMSTVPVAVQEMAAGATSRPNTSVQFTSLAGREGQVGQQVRHGDRLSLEGCGPICMP